MASISDIVESSEAERLATGFVFTEGPLWHPDDYLLFVDIRRSLIFRLTPGGEPEVFREDSGGSNGLTFDLQGQLIMCEGDNRRITRMEPDGAITPVAERWEGKRLNRPNDVVGHSDGSIYFTNPGGRLDASEREIDFSGVHRIAPDGAVTAVITDFEYPNGLAFSPDESVLYINDSRRGHIRAWDMLPPGALALGTGRIFADLRGDRDGVPDGMKVDVEGNVYCGGSGGVWVMDPTGKVLGIIVHGKSATTNIAWGDVDWKTLYITSRNELMRIRLNISGMPVPAA